MPITAKESSKCVLVSGQTGEGGHFILGRFEGPQPYYASAVRRVIDIADETGIRETAWSQMRHFKIMLKENCDVRALERFRDEAIRVIGVDYGEVVFEDPIGLFTSEQLAPAA